MSERKVYKEHLSSEEWVNIGCRCVIFRDPIIVFTGGSRINEMGGIVGNPDPSITIMRGKRLAVMQMDHDLVDFVGLCKSPFLTGTFFVFLSILSH